MSIEDLRSSNLCQHFWDYLPQKNYAEFLYLILEVKLSQMKAFCIFCISSINCFENEVINVRYTVSDSANV